MALDCTTCSACCLREGMLPIEQMRLEGKPISKELLAEATERAETCPEAEIPWCVWFVATQDSIDDGPCGRCRHYEQRPKCCSDFEKGSDKCLAAREWKGRVSVQASGSPGSG